MTPIQDREIRTMRALAKMFERLDSQAWHRVLHWAWDRYILHPPQQQADAQQDDVRETAMSCAELIEAHGSLDAGDCIRQEYGLPPRERERHA